MADKFKFIFIIIVLCLPFKCASVISEDISSRVNSSLSFTGIAKNPDAYKGQTVIWAGEIIECLNQKDGSSIIEVYQRPPGVRDAPDLSSESEGRFLIKSEMRLDNYIYRIGRKITVAGEILGDGIKHAGDIDYHYPLILGKEIYLWNDSYYYDEPYDPFHYPYPDYPLRRRPHYRH